MLKARDAVESRSWSHPQEPMPEVARRFLLIANHTMPSFRYAGAALRRRDFRWQTLTGKCLAT
jgi:hypothetical protein